MVWLPTIILLRLFFLAFGQWGRKISITTNVRIYQSSTYRGKINERNIYFDKRKAVDGDKNQNFIGGSCSHTDANHYTAWWQVYLGRRYEIDRIVIYYRQDKAERLKGFKIYVSENHEQISKRQYNAQQDNLCYEDKSKGNPSVFQNVSCVKAMAGKYVTIFNSRNGPEAFLELCEVEIYGCIVGTYGPDCRKRCSENCSDRRCNPNSGKCNKCYRTSKFGFDCSHRCPDNCRNNQCDGGSGKCESCKTNYHGFNCTEQCIGCLNGLCYQDSGTCANKTGCKEGFFGIRGSDLICNQSCVSLNCKICDIETGRCKECKSGFFGPDCEDRCSPGCQSSCHINTGKCNNCKPSFYGYTCNQICNTCQYRLCLQDGICIQGCKENYFGPRCSERCSIKCHEGICDSVTGHCSECINGYFGPHCETKCSSGCKNRCHINNGRCNNCKTFFYGNTCNQTCNTCKSGDCRQEDGNCVQGCKENYFGPQCSERCSNKCHGGICDSITGHCSVCSHSNYGNFCEQKCSKGCLNETCSRNGSCIEACVKGFYGEACDRTCPINCSAEGCDKHSANCHQCKTGMYGTRCDEQCPSRCTSKTCNQKTATCASCIKEYYGQYCNKTCSTGCKKKICVQMTGFCHFGCEDGFIGQSCQEECKDYSFGKNCMYTCGHCLNNDTCHFTNGSCLNGCEDTWTGDRCDKEMLQFLSDTYPVPVIAGSTLSTVIIVFVAGLVIFIYKRKKSRTSTDRRIQLDTHDNNTVEDSSSKNAFREPKNLNRNREYINAGMISANIHDNTISIGKDVVKFSFEGNATYTREITNDVKNADVVYSNIETSCIDVISLEKEITKKKSEHTFDLEYNKFPRDAVFPCTIASLPENKLLNRFLTTFPYDHSRVVLTDACGSDYINASYIDGVTDGKSYIATQGPKKNTVRDFWRMVWQVKSGKIIMLTNLVENIKSKCDQYWPDLSQSTKAGRLTIRLTHEKEFAFYVSRTFEVMDKQTTECRTVEQLHFTSWPDHGVPDQTELVIFHRRFLLKDNIQPGPPIVHCSAGIGRTGTFIALNALYLHGLTTGKLDVFNYVMSMRNNRMNMIQTKEQYVLLHDALVEQFKYDKTAISTHLFINFWNREKNMSLGKRKTKEEFKMLQCEKPKYCQEEFQSGHKKENKNKNRKENILPVEKYRIYLMSVDSSHTNYINAVMLQSVAKRFGYIATHYPLRSTVCDFWCMIFDQESEVIVALNGQGIDGTPWYPTPNDVLNCGRFVIKQTSQPTIFNDVQDTHLKLTNIEANEERDVKLFELMSWPSNTTVPTCKSNFLYLLKLVEQLKSDGPITVVCQDGASCCGVFCALSNILQSQIWYEEVNIFTTISQLQRRRPEFINSYEQYQFCHEIVEESLESASIYYNV